MLKIAKALAENSDAIFADEPTCNLDNGSIEYITNTLKYYSGSVVVISHDRYFLDEIVNKIWEIENGKITEYWGNYTQYLEQKEQENTDRKFNRMRPSMARVLGLETRSTQAV